MGVRAQFGCRCSRCGAGFACVVLSGREGNETLYGFTFVPDNAVLSTGNLIMGWSFNEPLVRLCGLGVGLAVCECLCVQTRTNDLVGWGDGVGWGGVERALVGGGAPCQQCDCECERARVCAWFARCPS